MGIDFNKLTVAGGIVSLPADYNGGLLFLVPTPTTGGFFAPNTFLVYRADQLLVLAPASILEGFGRQA